MCDFGISETIAAISASIAASTTAAAGSAATAGGVSAATAATIAASAPTIGAAAAGTAALAPGLGSLAALGSSIGATGTIASAAGGASAGIGLAESLGIASLVLGLGSGGASAGVSAKQSKDQGTLIKANARAEQRNITAQANQQSEASAQSAFEVAAAALAARGNAQSANLSDRSVRAITRAVGFQEGTDRATIKRNQEIANQAASARLQGVQITKESQRLQVGNPAIIAGTGALAAVAGGLNAGAGAYQAFSKFQIPTDGPNLAFV